MGGLYDLLETYRIQNDPRFAYEGLYQDPIKPKNNVYDYFTYNPDASPYGGATMYVDNLQPYMSSSFPQEFGVGSLFDPRVGRPEQSIYYNEPEPADPTSDFYQPLPGFINAPQNYYPAIRAMQPAPTSLGFDTSYGVANEEDEEQVEYLPGQEPQGIAKLFQKIGDIYSSLPTPMNILRGGLESLSGFNQRIRSTPFARSKTLAEYFDRRARAKSAARMAERAADFSERTSGAGATGGDRDFSTPAGKSTSYEEASRGFAASR